MDEALRGTLLHESLLEQRRSAGAVSWCQGETSMMLLEFGGTTPASVGDGQSLEQGGAQGGASSSDFLDRTNAWRARWDAKYVGGKEVGRDTVPLPPPMARPVMHDRTGVLSVGLARRLPGAHHGAQATTASKWDVVRSRLGEIADL
jgi:hypothetical protein